MAELFGPSLKTLLLEAANLPEVPNEEELLQAVCDKVGPYASKETLIWHIRASRGKIHWAVNSYLRAVLASTSRPPCEDFDPKPGQAVAMLHVSSSTARIACAAAQDTSNSSTSKSSLNQEQSSQIPSEHGGCDAGNAGAAAAAGAVPESSIAAPASAMRLDSLPGNALELILSFLDLGSLLHAARSCQTLHRAAQAAALWKGLFQQHWGATIFPTNTAGHSGCKRNSKAHCSCATGSQVGVMQDSTAGGAASGAATPGNDLRGSSGPSRLQRAPVPVFAAGPQQHVCLAAAAAAPAGSSSASSPSAAAAATVPPPVTAAGPALHAQKATAVTAEGASSSTAVQQPRQHDEGFISRWSGSCLSPRAAASSITGYQGSTESRADAGSGGAQRQVAGQHPISSSSGSNGNTAQQQQRQRSTAPSCSCSTEEEQLPDLAPAGSWQQQFKLQYSYQKSRKCPKCGAAATIVPIVYGFPSTALLAGMAAQRLVLGGDHLIDSCHVWACGSCRSCFRFFPYTNVQLWLKDDADQERQEQARAAAAGSSSRQGAAGPAVGGHGADGGGLQQHQQPGGATAAGDPTSENFPRYTYEL